VCLRLSPVLPSPRNSYALGLTNVRLRAYIAGSAVGCLPNVAAQVYVGSLLDSLADIRSGGPQRSPLSWLLIGLGGAATVAALVYVSRVAAMRVEATKKEEGSSPCLADDKGGMATCSGACMYIPAATLAV